MATLLTIIVPVAIIDGVYSYGTAGIMGILVTRIARVSIMAGGYSYGQDYHYGHSQTWRVENIILWAAQVGYMLVTIFVV